MDLGDLISVCMVKVCVWNVYRDRSSGFWWRQAVGETPTSATTLTYLVILLEVKLQYGCLCKIQVEGLSGVAEIFGKLLKLHLVKMDLFIHYCLHQIQHLPQNLCYCSSFICASHWLQAYWFVRKVCTPYMKAIWFSFRFFLCKT